MIEWTVYCGRDLATAKGNPIVINITNLKLGPEVEDPRNVLKILLSGLLWSAQRSWVNDIAVVLGKRLGDIVQVLPPDDLEPFEDEFDLWGMRARCVGHWDGVIEGGLPGDPEAS